MLVKAIIARPTCHLRGKSAFTLVEIMIVVGVIALLASIAVPNYLRARRSTWKSTCINNLRQLDSAKHQWAQERQKTDTDVPSPDDLKVYIKNEVYPSCPAGGVYTIGALNTDPTCSKSGEGHALPPP